MIVNSGLRLREAYRLKRGQVDLDGKVLRVQSSKQWRGKVAWRDVPMRPEVHAALVAYLASRPMLAGADLFPFLTESPGLTGPVPVGLKGAPAVVPDGAGFAHHLFQPLGWPAVAYHRWRVVRNGSILCRINGLHDLVRC